MAKADLICAELKRCGIEFLIWLPDSESRFIYDRLATDASIRVVQVCHEEEAMGIYAGLYMGGRRAAVLIQNTGLLHSLDAMRGLIITPELPLLLLVGYRAYKDMFEEQPLDLAGVYTEPVLDAMGVKHYLLKSEQDAELVSKAHRETHASRRPVAVLIP